MKNYTINNEWISLHQIDEILENHFTLAWLPAGLDIRFVSFEPLEIDLFVGFPPVGLGIVWVYNVHVARRADHGAGACVRRNDQLSGSEAQPQPHRGWII